MENVAAREKMRLEIEIMKVDLMDLGYLVVFR